MKVNKFTGLLMALLSLASFIVCAADYIPEDYNPKDIYTEQKISISSVFTPETTQKTQKADVDINHEVITGYKESTRLVRNATVQSEKTTSSGSMIVFIAALLAMGRGVFRRLIHEKSSNHSYSSSANAIQGSTGVERYVERLVITKTGVEKYLERQAKIIPATGVAKYLARQVDSDYYK